MYDPRRKLIVSGLIVIILSIICLLLFMLFDFVIIHPVLCMFGIITGLGWFFTGCAMKK